MSQARGEALVHVTASWLQASAASTIMWWPVLEPQIVGVLSPAEVAENWALWHWVLDRDDQDDQDY